MRSKENCQSEVISAWSISALQAMDECPQGGFEVLEKMSLEIIDSIIEECGEIPLSPDVYIDIYDVPLGVFNVAENDVKLKDLARSMKSLSIEFQKLLHYIAKGYDPKSVCESMDFQNVTIYWEKRSECMVMLLGEDKELSENEIKNILIVYDRYTKIRNNFLINTDLILSQNQKKKNKSKWIISGIAVVILPLAFFLFAYPKIIQKDFQTLFDYGVEKSAYVMTIDSTELLDDMIFEEEEYSPESYWLLSLKALQNGDQGSCREYLKALKESDYQLYKEKGHYINKRLKR